MSILFCADSCSDKELKIVDNGPIAIMNVMFSDDITQKERLLFYLTHYLDPVCANDLEKRMQILDILQYSLLTEKSYDIQYTLFYLLYKHTTQRLLILENNFDLLEMNIKDESLKNSIILLIQFHYTINEILNK